MDSCTYEDVEPYVGEDPLPLFRGDCSVLPIYYACKEEYYYQYNGMYCMVKWWICH